MSVLSSIAVVHRRFWTSYIVVDDYDQQQYLSDHLTKELYGSRIPSIQHLVQKDHPSNYIENAMLIVSAVFIVIICVISMLVRMLDQNMMVSTLPFFLLFLPIIMILWGARRRATFNYRLKAFEEKLDKLLKMFTEEDITKEIKWEHRRIRAADTWENLRISKRSGKLVRVTLVIQALHVDANNEMANMGDELLPAYNNEQPHTVVEINPSDLPNYSEATVPSYEELDISDAVALARHQQPLPPDSTGLPEYELSVVQNQERGVCVTTPLPLAPVARE